jgi:deazaflavin-dependent oxidoreductase (nitroreductase family)
LLDRAMMTLVSAMFRWRGQRVITLTTVGSQTGLERNNDLIAVPDGDSAWFVVASAGGSARHPAWYVNMARNPDLIWVKDGPRRVRVEAENVAASERQQVYQRFVDIYGGYAGYERKTDREIPVVRLSEVA